MWAAPAVPNANRQERRPVAGGALRGGEKNERFLSNCKVQWTAATSMFELDFISYLSVDLRSHQAKHLLRWHRLWPDYHVRPRGPLFVRSVHRLHTAHAARWFLS